MRSFEIGDQIVVGEAEGTVERIEVRVTHIRTYDGRLVLVPNARRSDFMSTSCSVRAAIVHALMAAGVELPNPDHRPVDPGDVQRWRAIIGFGTEANPQ